MQPIEQNEPSKATVHPKYSREFLQKGFEVSLNHLETTLHPTDPTNDQKPNSSRNKVIKLLSPQSLHKQIDFKLSQQPCTPQHLLSQTQKILSYQTKPYHPHFHNQLFGGFDQYSILGAMMTPLLNGSVYTYQLAPCFTLMEMECYEMFRGLLRWDVIDGVFTPGGSFANFMAISTARFANNPKSKQKGNGNRALKVLTSETSHYSMKKGVNFCGIGEDNLVQVKADQSGRMIVEDLEKVIQGELQKDNKILMVNATMGTTVEGSIDPIEEIGLLCKKHKIWLHVDAALGGLLIFSPDFMKGRQKMFQNVDSITIDAHKGLLVPLQCSVFLCKRKQLLFKANSTKADYLFHKQRASYTSQLDVGDKSLQCGRVIDVFKFWTYLKGNGLKGIAAQVEQQCRLAQYCKRYVLQNDERWILVVKDVETINVCFWYVPKMLDKGKFSTEERFYERLSQVTVLAKKYMIEEGKMLVGYSKAKVKHYFWRTVMSNPYIGEKDIDYEMDLISKYCEMAYEEILRQQKKYHEENSSDEDDV